MEFPSLRLVLARILSFSGTGYNQSNLTKVMTTLSKIYSGHVQAASPLHMELCYAPRNSICSALKIFPLFKDHEAHLMNYFLSRHWRVRNACGCLFQKPVAMFSPIRAVKKRRQLGLVLLRRSTQERWSVCNISCRYYANILSPHLIREGVNISSLIKN